MSGRARWKARGPVPLTGRGRAVLALAVVSYGAGVLAGHPVFLALAGVALGSLLAAVALTVPRPHVDVRRDLYPDRVERGRPALATLRVRNTGRRWQPAFVAHDVVDDVPVSVTVRALPLGAEATYRYELPTTRRGRLQVGPLALERSDPLGLARRWAEAGDSTELWVQPKRHPTRTVVAGRPRHHHESRTTDDALRGSEVLRDVRPYVIGDEVRHMHWRATARVGRLMVRDCVDPDQPRLTILLDTRSGALDPDGFEEAVEVVASVAFSAAIAGHHCRLLTPYGLDLAPAAGPAAARVLLDTLTEIAQAEGESLLPSSSTTGRADGGAFVAVTGPGVAGPELAPAVARHRSVTVVSMGTATHATSAPSPATGSPLRWIGATGAADAVRQWNLEA